MMKKLIALTFLFLVFIFPKTVLADFDQSYNDFTYNYSLYRQAHNEYLVAKSAYQTYKTITAQNEAILKFRQVLKLRNQIMTVYYDLVIQKVPSEQLDTFYKIKTSQQAWLKNNQIKIDAASTLEDLNSVSREFESRYPQMDLETKQAVGDILYARESNLGNQLTTTIASLDAMLTNDTLAQRGVLTTKSKMDIYKDKMVQAQDAIRPKNMYQTDLLKLLDIQKALADANQYLREASNYLNEIIATIYGK